MFHPHLLQDFCDGTACKEHPAIAGNDCTMLQIVAYFDELEVTNPIGSYVKKHKLGCIFFTIGNIRPAFRSSLKAIFLVAVAKCSDIDTYGIDTFLKPFVEELKLLYLDGLCVNGTKYRGALIAFLADTQAAHKVGGFKGSVAFAQRICRTCMAARSDVQKCFDESDFVLRTPKGHEEQCLLLADGGSHDNSVKFGINRMSILEEVPGFSVATGLPHDIMHDLFEGVVHYELKLFLDYCLSQRFFTIEALNIRIQGFDFGHEDKPSLIDPKSMKDEQLARKFTLSAAQTIFLIHNLPLIIGDKIPSDQEDKNWNSVLILVKICQIALSPIISQDTVAYLRLLVTEKL